MPNILITGGRAFHNYKLLAWYLDHVLSEIPTTDPIVIVHGGARGTDTLAQQYAQTHGYDAVVIRPRYDRHPPSVAPLIRNSELVAIADYCVAFWNGRSGGTKDAKEKAERKGIPVRVRIVEYP